MSARNDFYDHTHKLILVKFTLLSLEVIVRKIIKLANAIKTCIKKCLLECTESEHSVH